jgi:phosphate transport system substrate-binding protein
MIKNSLVIVLVAIVFFSCGGNKSEKQTIETETNKYEGDNTLKIDGSSTVYPISEALAEEFRTIAPDTRITVGLSGTGGGFKKFIRSELDLTGASRPITASEDSAAKAGGVEYFEVPVAYDGLVVVVHPSNDWVKSITVNELKKIWEPAAQGKILKWNQIRPEWPNQEIHLFGAGTESGTFDYFTDAIVGKAKSCRGDYTASEDDNVLVQGVSTDKLAMGFFGYAYFNENQDRLKVLPIDDQNDANGKGAITSNATTILDATYQPLSRPLFIYANKKAYERPLGKDFLLFLIDQSPKLVPETGYVPFDEETYKLVKDRLVAGKTGSLFLTLKSTVGVNLKAELKK